MKKKKKAKKKRNRPRKGVMPPALKRYWAKKRAKKNSGLRRKKKPTAKQRKAYLRKSRRLDKYKAWLKLHTGSPKGYSRQEKRAQAVSWFGQNPKRRKKTKSLKQAKSILLSELRKAGYAVAPKRNRRRRAKKNSRRRKARRNPPRSIRIPGTVTPKQRKAIGRFLARSTGRRIVYKKAGRR